MKIGAFMVARLSSSRLRGKNLLPILGKPMIQHLYERVRRSKEVDLVVLATSTDPSDDPLCAFAKEAGIPFHRGPLDDVMDRVGSAAEVFHCDTIVEILGDNPLVHSDLIDDTVEYFRKGSFDYVASLTSEYREVDQCLKRFPLGVRVQVYRKDVAWQWRVFPDFYGSEHGTTAYIFCNPDRFQCGYLEAGGRWEGLKGPELNFAVNYENNFKLIEKIFKELYPIDENFSLPKVMEWLRSHPEHLALMVNEVKK